MAVKRRFSALLVFCLGAASSFAATSPDSALRVGLNWLARGKTESALPYLIPHLALLNPMQLEYIEGRLENSRHAAAALVVLRYHASIGKTFLPESGRAGALAFRTGQFQVCRDLLAPFAGDLDSASAHRLLLANFYIGGKLDPGIIRKAASRSGLPEVQALASLNLSLQGNFKEARSYLDGQTPPPVRNFIHALELDAGDKTDEATDYFKQALDSKWPEFHTVAMAELFKHYAITGNRYKADQLWELMKGGEEDETPPALQELLAWQLGIRNYEKQAHYLYTNLYGTHPDRPVVLKALWNELVMDDSTSLRTHIQSLLSRESLDCDANIFAMRYARAHHSNLEVVYFAGNVLLYCPDAVEPYLDLANALLELSRPAEARVYFGKYVERGGDRNKVPTYMR